jgi:hypothetical protein
VTTIFDTEDCEPDPSVGVVELNRLRSNDDAVGEVKLCCDDTLGENAPCRDPPTTPAPPPPPCDRAAVDAAADEAKFDVEKGVVVRDRGERIG